MNVISLPILTKCVIVVGGSWLTLERGWHLMFLFQLQLVRVWELVGTVTVSQPPCVCILSYSGNHAVEERDRKKTIVILLRLSFPPRCLQVEFAEDEISCLSGELLALRHTWFYFDRQPDSAPHWQAKNFTMPGFSPGLLFQRI
jgi:hypothetical protein